MRLLRVTAWLCVAFGLLVALSSVGHVVGSTRTALVEREGLDARYRLMLAVGWMLLAGGAGLAAAGTGLLKGRAWGRPAALVACGFLLGTFSILYTVGGPGIPITLALGALVWFASRRPGLERAPSPA